MRSSTRWLAVVLSWAMVGVVQAELLDGKTYTGTIKETGAETGDPDDLVFEDGTFLSTACEKYGFQPAAYTATDVGGKITFKTHASNDEGGQMYWIGFVQGESVQAEAQYTDSEGNATKYSYQGAEKEEEAEEAE